MLGEWAVIMLLRSPGLVLMYSAAIDSLVIPSFPLDPGSATIFKFAQVGVAILILTQTLLPLAGALLLGTWLYLFRWGWYVAMDALPILIVAAIYVSSPWQSHKFTIVQLNAKQMKWVRCLLLLYKLEKLMYTGTPVAGFSPNYIARSLNGIATSSLQRSKFFRSCHFDSEFQRFRLSMCSPGFDRVKTSAF